MALRIAVSERATGIGIQGAKVTVDLNPPVEMFTDAKGYADFPVTATGFIQIHVKALGHNDYNSAFGAAGVNTSMVNILITPSSQPPPVAPDELDHGRVGTSCSIISKVSFGQRWYYVRHDRNGLSNVGTDTVPKAQAIANQRPDCFEIPPQPAKSAEEISSEVSGLGAVVNGVLSILDGIKKSISDLTAGIQNETKARIQALIDIEARLKAWIADQVLILLLTKLMEGRGNVNRR
jgi:hypothetical protein